MNWRWSIALFCTCVLIFGVATVPLFLAAHWFGPKDLAFAQAQGTVWGGSMRAVQMDQIRLDQVTLAVRPWHLLTGRVVADIFWDSQDLSGQGRVSRSLFSEHQMVRYAVVRMNLSQLPISGFDLAGEMQLDVTKLERAGSACKSVEGTVWTNTLVLAGRQVGWDGPALEGPLTCEEGRLTARLSDPSGILALVQLDERGGLLIDIEVESPNVLLAAGLAQLGFQRRADDMHLSLSTAEART